MAEFSTTTITPADGVQLPAVNGNTAGNMTLQALSDYEKTKLDIQDNLTSTATDKPLSANQGKVLKAEIDEKVDTDDIVDNVITQDSTKALSANMGYELQSEINNLKAYGRFLSLWNCATGLPATNPTVLPYAYKSGDYYIVSTANGSSSLMPSGSSYTGVASVTVDTDTPSINDFYFYDGTNWRLLINSGKSASFANIAGSPSDNQALAAALNGKQATLTFDNTPIENSDNPVKSGGVYNAISAIIAVIKTYHSGTEWYRIWSDGWCEQGGYHSSGVWGTVTYLKPFADTNYQVLSLCEYSSGVSQAVSNKTTTNCQLYQNYPTDWYACGYLDPSDEDYPS